jgi:hypothetical protein
MKRGQLNTYDVELWNKQVVSNYQSSSTKIKAQGARLNMLLAVWKYSSILILVLLHLALAVKVVTSNLEQRE